MRPAWRLVLTHVTYHGSSFVVKQRNATQRMRLHRTTTSHHPCTGAGQADAVEFLFPDDGRGIYAAHTYATGDFVSVRSASTSSGNLPCLCCARHHVTSRHAALRHSRAFPSILSIHPAVAKHIRVLHLQNQSYVVSSATPRHAAVCESGDLVSWPWMSARRRPHVLFSRCAIQTSHRLP